MKNIYLILIAVFVAFSCEQEEFEGSGLESLRDFELSPVSGARIELSSVAPDEEVVISWNEARSGFNSTVNYTWLIDEVGGDFSSPLLALPSDNNGIATQISLTNEEFDQALAALGLNIGEEIEVQWTVSATNGDLTKLAEANTITIRRYVDGIAPFSLIAPSDESTLELDIDNPSNTIVIEWDSTFSGLGNQITYKWVADEAGGDFTDPILEINSDDSGLAHILTLTHQQMEDSLTALGVAEADYYTLDWKVIASGNGLIATSQDVFTLELRRFNPVQAKYLVGAATPGGWGWDNPTEIVEVSEGIFAGTLNFTNEAFRIFDIKGDWGSGTNFPYYLNDGYTIDDRFEDALDGDNNFKFTGTPGEYTFTLNTINKTITLTVGPSKFMVGAATPGGWGWDNPTEMLQTTSGVWVATLNFTNDTFRFFDTKDDWGSGSNFPYYVGEGYTIDGNFEDALDGDNNFKFIGTPGEYKITLDSNVKTITLE